MGRVHRPEKRRSTMLSLSGHELPRQGHSHVLRRGCRFRPLLRGGRQARPCAPAPKTAASSPWAWPADWPSSMDTENTAGEGAARQLKKASSAGCRPYCHNPSNRLPNTCNVCIEYVEGEAILLLNKLGIACSSGWPAPRAGWSPTHVMAQWHPLRRRPRHHPLSRLTPKRSRWVMPRAGHDRQLRKL